MHKALIEALACPFSAKLCHVSQRRKVWLSCSTSSTTVPGVRKKQETAPEYAYLAPLAIRRSPLFTQVHEFFIV